MKEDTKTRILERGAEIIHLKGFNHTGVQEVLRAAGVPKGSFYNYFKNKEDFGLQVIDYFFEFFSGLARETLGDRSVPPLERIRNFLSWFMEFFKSKDFAYGCPIGNLAQEMGDLSPAFREKLRQGLDAMVDLYAEVLAEAQESGDLSKSLDVQEAAYFLVYSWHGALMHMKAVKGPAPLENHLKSIFDYVLNS
jgi:TetR/AcrR family transcriptional regulator, transcriptional repressor for nem operon